MPNFVNDFIMHSSESVVNQQPLIGVLIKVFLEDQPVSQAIHLPEVRHYLEDNSWDFNEFGQVFSKLKLDDLPHPADATPSAKLARYLTFQRYIIQFFNQVYIKDGGQPTPSYNLERQRRVTLPDAEAYELMGFNNLNVKENKKGYAFIYG